MNESVERDRRPEVAPPVTRDEGLGDEAQTKDSVPTGLPIVKGSRFYYVNGRPVPRVSTVLGPCRDPRFDAWRERVGPEAVERAMDDAGVLGSLVHELTRLMDQDAGVPSFDSYDHQVRSFVAGWVVWKRVAVARIEAIEAVVHSPSNGFAGTCDRLLVLKGDLDLTVTDIKTGMRSQKWACQTAAYRLAAREAGLGANRRLVVSFDKANPGRLPRVIEYMDHRQDEARFLYALARWRHYHEEANLDVPDLACPCTG